MYIHNTHASWKKKKIIMIRNLDRIEAEVGKKNMNLRVRGKQIGEEVEED